MTPPRRPTRPFGPDDTTPPPLPGESSEHMRAIARDEAEAASGRAVAEHVNQCGQAGHIAAIWEAINEARRERAQMAAQHEGLKGEISGALKQQTRTVALLVAGLGILGLLAQGISIMVRMRWGV